MQMSSVNWLFIDVNIYVPFINTSSFLQTWFFVLTCWSIQSYYKLLQKFNLLDPKFFTMHYILHYVNMWWIIKDLLPLILQADRETTQKRPPLIFYRPAYWQAIIVQSIYPPMLLWRLSDDKHLFYAETTSMLASDCIWYRTHNSWSQDGSDLN